MFLIERQNPFASKIAVLIPKQKAQSAYSLSSHFLLFLSFSLSYYYYYYYYFPSITKQNEKQKTIYFWDLQDHVLHKKQGDQRRRIRWMVRPNAKKKKKKVGCQLLRIEGAKESCAENNKKRY